MSDFRKRLRALAILRGCTIPGCTRPVRSLGTLCPSHLRARQVYGHALAKRPDHKALEPHINAASALLHRNRKHPSIIALIDWIEARIAEGDFQTAQLGPRLDARNPHHRAAAFWGQLKHVGALYVLAVTIGVYARHLEKPDTFHDWAHFGAAITYLLTRKLPAHATGRRGDGRLMHADKGRTLPPRARELWLAHYLNSLGPAARMAANQVLRMLKPPPASAALADLASTPTNPTDNQETTR